MNRRDYLIFALLIGLLFAWPIIDRELIKKKFYGHAPAARPVEEAPIDAQAEPIEPELAAAPAAPEPAADGAPTPETETSRGPEKTATLSNDRLIVTFSSHGGSIKDATLKDYSASMDEASGPVVLDFSDGHALAYADVPGFDARADFDLSVDERAKSVRFERSNGRGLRFVRTMQLGDSYEISIADTITNETAAPALFPASTLQTGPMRREAGKHDEMGFAYLGVDTLSPGGEGVQHLGGKIAGLFKREMEDNSLPKLPVDLARSPRDMPVDWVAAKSKYFVQIVTPEEGGDNSFIHATRALDPREAADPAFAPKMTPVEMVAVSVQLPAIELQGGQALTRTTHYYVGPMKYAELHKMSMHRADVMELGMWRPIGKVLLVVMNFIQDHVWPHNYGLAIILLTLIVKIVFWPITHKSTESMKRMAAMQPMVNEIRAKHKDNPQRVQQEIMALYKEHKINPIGGCLPMLIQIPIFIALFMVLRSAIELRFASFLWIKDLSEPENLFAGVVGFPINILPLAMAGTMYLQQKMTPTAGDPAQAKMMRIMMPGMMLFFLYNYAAGLALYWTTQNLLMILQQVMMQRKKK